LLQLCKLAVMDAKLLGTDEFTAVAKQLKEDYGTAEDDKLEKNQKLDDFIDDFGDVNFYVCTTLLVIDPNQEFESFRSNLKIVLLPCFQILVPFGMIWYFLVYKDMITDNGYCCNHSNFIFRFTGFVTFMYSAWQIIDGCDDAPSKFFMRKSVNQFALTGQAASWKATWMFFLGHLSQQVCAIFLLVLTCVIYTTQCDTPLDLLMNCVAINFVLDIDSEWMDDSKQAKSKAAATYLFKYWRDDCRTNEASIRESIQGFRGLRRAAPKIINGIHKTLETAIWIGAYFLVFAWTFCPPSL